MFPPNISPISWSIFAFACFALVNVPVLAFDEFDPFPLPNTLKWNTNNLHQKKINTHTNQKNKKSHGKLVAKT